MAFEEPEECRGVFFYFQPGSQMVFVGKILVRHVAWVTAKGDLADGVDTEKRNDGLSGVAADLVAVDEALTGNDDAPGCAGQVEISNGGPSNAAVAEAVGLVDVDGGHVG